jgi:hypothetical protein
MHLVHKVEIQRKKTVVVQIKESALNLRLGAVLRLTALSNM